MTRRRAILHIGQHKTGTSFIQHQFRRNEAVLRAHGVLYPLREANHSFALSGLFRRRNPAKAPSVTDHYVAAGEQGRRDFAAELAGADWSRLMLSGEVVSTFRRADLIELRDWLRGHVDVIRIVLVVRDPVDWAVSVAQERLKTRGDVATLLAQPAQVRWADIVTRMREVFGQRALTVLEYEQLATVRERFAARFALSAGLPPRVAATLNSAAEGVNEALSMEAALMLGRFNARVPERLADARNAARSGLEAQAFIGLPGNRFDLPDAARRLAYEQSRDDVAFLAREFGITRYSYAASAIAPSRYSEAMSPAFLDALADRLVALNAAATAGGMLLDAGRLRDKGEAARAEALLRDAAHRFPADRHVARAMRLRSTAAGDDIG